MELLVSTEFDQQKWQCDVLLCVTKASMLEGMGTQNVKYQTVW
jgi:hypothetical protein